MAVDVTRRNAFARVPFADYFRVDEQSFHAVSPEAFRQSDPLILERRVNSRSDYSLWSPEKGVGYVLMSAAEYNIVLDHPEAFARRAEAEARYDERATYRGQDERNAFAVQEGAEALKRRIPRMHNLAVGYKERIGNIRKLRERIPHYFYAHDFELNMRIGAEAVRGGARDVLQTVADIDSWSAHELELALAGLDKRLMDGSGKEALNRKIREWMSLSTVIGNHTIQKKVIVRDRVFRSEADIEKRQKQVERLRAKQLDQ